MLCLLYETASPSGASPSRRALIPTSAIGFWSFYGVDTGGQPFLLGLSKRPTPLLIQNDKLHVLISSVMPPRMLACGLLLYRYKEVVISDPNFGLALASKAICSNVSLRYYLSLEDGE